MCQKCVMLGGTEEPCVSRDALLGFQIDKKTGEFTGRYCPRIRLNEENVPLAEVAWYAIKLGGDHPLFLKAFEMQSEGLGTEDRLEAFYKIMNAVSDEGIAARIKAARERASKGE